MSNMITGHQAALLRDMETYRQLRGPGPVCYEYSCIQDFLLREGVWYHPCPLPAGVPYGAPKSCFGNALLLAIQRGWTYVEGLAIPDIGVHLPVHHGWNVTPDGNLIDATWRTIGLAYIGVPFSIGRADHAQWFDNACVLDNPRDRFRIYKEKWQGENWHKVWRKSKARKQIEQYLEANRERSTTHRQIGEAL